MQGKIGLEEHFAIPETLSDSKGFLGDAVWPVEVLLRFENGKLVRRLWDGRDRWLRYRCTGPRLLEAIVDPDRKCLLLRAWRR